MKRLFCFAGLGSRFVALTLLFLSSFNNISAQCFEADGVTVRPSFFNIWVAMDQTWVDRHGGDEDLARMVAKSKADDAIALLNGSFAFNTTFRIQFVRGFCPAMIAPEFPGGDKGAWCIDVNDFYSDQYPCLVGRDAILLFTDRFGVSADYAFANVALIGGGSSQVIAHELGHIFDVPHSSTSSGNPNCCTTSQTMMCIPFPTNPVITLLNTACGITFDWLNTNVFTSSRCGQMLTTGYFADDDFECPPANNLGYNVSLENPNPVLNCRTDGDIVTVTAEFFNNSQQVSRNFRVLISQTASANLEFVTDPASPFNCIVTLPSGSKEFRITDPSAPGCENETFFPFLAGETKTLVFKLRYLGGLGQFQNNIPVNIYTNHVVNFGESYDFFITPYKAIPSGSFSTIVGNGAWSYTNPLIITGKLIMNPATTPTYWGGSVYNFGLNKSLLFAPGAELEIAPGNTVKMPNVQIEGCSTMWRGITVRDGATLEMDMATSVADAQFAVNVQKGGTANIQSSKFVNNNFGIRTAPEGTGVHNITALGNRFITTDAGLKPKWGITQVPAPGEKGFAGIHVKDFTGGLSIDKDLVFNSTNEFSNLHYGILAENTDVTVRDATFTDIVQETRPSGYPGPLSTGNAIYLSGGNANIKGNYTGIVPGPLAMDNCHTGINTRAGSITVEGCEMSNMTNGVVAIGGTNKSYAINWNNIGASDRGISVFYQSGIPGASNITNNAISMAGNSNGVGIAAGGQEMFPQNEGLVANNHVTVAEGATGIQIGVANKLKVTQNNVSLSGSGTLFGIKVEGGDRNTLNCNIVTNSGSGNNAGIYAIHAGRASVLCNVTDGPARGLHFEGMLGGRNKADVAGNTMESNTTAGLLLGTDAVIGGQPNRGNKFDGTEAIAGLGAQLHSLVTVDAAENPDFLPNAWSPFPWFLNISDPALSYQCAPGTTCPLPPVVSDYSLDIATVKGQLGGTTYPAANQWLAQRRFYELVQEEGNPYPGNTDVSTFLSQAQTNGIAGYANVQVGIRSLGAMTALHRAATAASLLTLNGLLADSAIYAVNEKSVNQIFLQTLALGNTDLTETQITVLEGIAEGCPLSDGEAVLRARTMLEVLQGAPVQYDDAAICAGAERANPLPTAQYVRVYPNPANNMVTVEYKGMDGISHQFMLFNALGQLVRSVTLPQGQSSLQLPLGNLSEGIYWYAIPGAPDASGKLIISR